MTPVRNDIVSNVRQLKWLLKTLLGTLNDSRVVPKSWTTCKECVYVHNHRKNKKFFLVKVFVLSLLSLYYTSKNLKNKIK